MTQVLLRYLIKTALVMIPVATLLAYLVLGESVALGVIIGGVLALADGAGLVYLVGQLLLPKTKLGKPALFFFLLFGKLALVAGLLWASLMVWGVSGLGLIFGIAVALAALVLGVNRGSSSPSGQRAMSEDEARIAQELGDNDAESS